MSLVCSWRKVTIVAGASLSDALDINGMEVLALGQGASCEGTVFTFQGALDGETFVNIQTDAAELSVTKSATASEVYQLPEAKRLIGYTHIKVRTGTAAGPTVQVTADATIWVCLRELGSPP